MIKPFRTATAILFYLSSLLLLGQLPETLQSTRSIVIVGVQFNDDGEYLVDELWKEEIRKIHANLKLMRIDAIAYVNSITWFSNARVRADMEDHFKKREVFQVITLSQAGSSYSLSIRMLDEENPLWDTSASSIRALFIDLANDIRKKKFQSGNFLINDEPEIFQQLSAGGQRVSRTFPTRIQGVKVGVPRFKDQASNRALQEIMGRYPFEYELFDYVNDEDAYRKGYSYILVRINARADAIRKLFKIPSKDNETVFISTSVNPDGSEKLKPIQASSFVNKYYIQHTITREAFIGKTWDADVDWKDALRNFCYSVSSYEFVK